MHAEEPEAGAAEMQQRLQMSPDVKKKKKTANGISVFIICGVEIKET